MKAQSNTLSQGRTRRSVRNALVGLSLFAGMLILQFFSRKVFIDYLSVEILGLNSLVSSIMEFLNIAESGIGVAIAFSIYKPLAENNKREIEEIIAIHKNLYRKVAFVMLSSALLLCFFFPLIFKKTDLPLWYAYSTFAVFLFSSMVGYVWNYKQVLLSAGQEEYKVQAAYRIPKLIQILLQIVCIIRWKEIGYQLWLVWEVIGTIVSSLLLNKFIKNRFPNYNISYDNIKKLRAKYPIVEKKIKQLMFHKIGGFVVKQMSPIVIYSYLSLTIVAIYGNYILIVNGINRLIDSIFRGLEAFVGNVVNFDSSEKQFNIFKELLSLRFGIASFCSFGFLVCVKPFTQLWVGNEYLLSETSAILISLVLFIGIFRGAVETFTTAAGIVGDIWAPIAEGGISIGLSLLLGYFYGLSGILSGVITALVIFVFFWKPYYLFRNWSEGEKKRRLFYFYGTIIKLSILSLLLVFITIYLGEFINCEGLLKSAILTVIYLVLYCIFSFIVDNNTRKLFQRFTR